MACRPGPKADRSMVQWRGLQGREGGRRGSDTLVGLRCHHMALHSPPPPSLPHLPCCCCMALLSRITRVHRLLWGFLSMLTTAWLPGGSSETSRQQAQGVGGGGRDWMGWVKAQETKAPVQ